MPQKIYSTILLFCLLLIAIDFSVSTDRSYRSIIIDTDAGSDDALAILLLLRAEKQPKFPYKVIAITCTYGNTKEENVQMNVLKTLTIANRTDIPVYGGAKKPLIEKIKTDNHFGSDGFGDIEFLHKITATVKKSAHASVILVELTKKYKDVSILVLGPTTNVALATSLDPKFTSRVKQFFVMGSSVLGRGNIRPNVEFNFGADPEANFILLSSTKASQLTLFPWEAAYQANIPKIAFFTLTVPGISPISETSPADGAVLEWRKQTLGTYKSPFIDFLNKVEAIGLTTVRLYVPADALTVASMLWPNIITSTISTNVEPVTSGQARGSVLVDYQHLSNLQPNTRIVQAILPDRFKELLVYYLSCEYIPC